MRNAIILFMTIGMFFLIRLPCYSENTLDTAENPELSDNMTKNPHLIFKKSVVVKNYKKGRVLTEQHMVKRGEYLWNILRERYKISESKIAFFCKIAKFINPEVKDINKLYPDQDIIIPYKYLEGNVHTDKKTGPEINGEEYTVKKGDYFAKILRENYEIMGPAIFSRQTMTLFKRSNPGINNINKLKEGQRIVIPAELLALQSRFIPIGELQSKKNTETDPAAERLKASAAGIIKSEPDVLDLSDNASITKEMLDLLAKTFDGTDNQTGVETFEMAGRGELNLDYSKFPLYKFPWGKKVLFDYGNKIPEGVKAVIHEKWKNAEIVGVQERDDIESILDRVLDSCGFFKVEKGGEYTASRDNIQISVSGNWIVFKDDSLKNVFVVNLIKDENDLVSPALKSYLSGLGLTFVDINPGKIKASKKERSGNPPAYKKISPKPVLMTDTVLDIIGVKYKIDEKINVFQNKDTGFSLEVIADRVFEKGGTLHMIDFQSLPLRLYDIIMEQGFEILNVSEEENVLTVAEKVLVFCDAEFDASPAEFQYKKNERSKLSLKIPGVLIKSGQGDILLTDTILADSIINFLADIKVKIIQF